MTVWSRPASAPPSAFAMNAPGISPYAATSNTCGEQLGRDDRPDQPEDHQRVPVERQARRPQDDPSEDRVGDRTPARRPRATFWIAMTATHSAPSSRPGEHRLDQAAGDDVRRPDGEQDEAPEDPEVHQARGQVPEHPRLDEAVRGRCPTGARRDPVGGRRVPGRREHPQVARHRQREERDRPPEHREDQRVERDLGERLEHRSGVLRASRRQVGAARGPGRGVVERPGEGLERVVEDRAHRTSNDSRAPLGDPGTFTTSDPPRTPTSPRESDRERRGAASLGAHRLRDARDLVVQDAAPSPAASRRAASGPVPPVADDQRGAARRPSTRACAIRAMSSGTTRRSTANPRPARRSSRPRRTRPGACPRRSGR